MNIRISQLILPNGVLMQLFYQRLKKEFKLQLLIICKPMECLICLGELENPETLPCCSKTFCSDCLSNWINVRNICPHCITPIGDCHKNQLAIICTEEFDNGCFMLETEIADIIQRFHQLRALLKVKRQASFNHKSLFPKSRLEYAEREMKQLEENIEIASVAITENDRVTAVSTIQGMMEIIHEIEDVLSGRSQFEHMEYSSDEDYEDHDYEQENRLHKIAEEQKRKLNVKKSNKKKTGVDI